MPNLALSEEGRRVNLKGGHWLVNLSAERDIKDGEQLLLYYGPEYCKSSF